MRYGSHKQIKVKMVQPTAFIYTPENTYGIDMSLTSPIRYDRACLCQDETYSIECCEGRMINQGIGKIIGRTLNRAFSKGFSKGFK
jgi:hypothetical protein